ncbi:uncharacterized protein LOC113383417 [Ctenocephalides felis]|uniref:uncharacterized protein LOC113383417 n=1 Tax=Ctenocephalides felis TaxID=7515 RepID=UPI000E6E1CAF|nr:uncharacterized protein LOC113383417 [Ctenocephalides felis]
MCNLALLIKAVLIAHLVNVICSLQLEGLSTKKPRTTKYQKSTPSSVLDTNSQGEEYRPPPTPSTTSLYRVNNSNGITCILMKTDALISIQYRDKLGEDKEADSFVPDNAKVTGDCKYEDTASMTISWKGFNLAFGFAKTPGGERWYVNKVDLSYSTSNKLFEHVDKPRVDLDLSTPPGRSTLLFPTPVGKSFKCDSETAVDLTNYDENIDTTQSAKVYLRDFRLQAFMYKADNNFGPPFGCTLGGSVRSETAPIAVGSTLAIAVLCTVTGYGVFRYMKVKKVQYDTME